MEKEINVFYLPKNKNTMEQRFEGSAQTSPVCIVVLSPVSSGPSRVEVAGQGLLGRGLCDL